MIKTRIARICATKMNCPACCSMRALRNRYRDVLSLCGLGFRRTIFFKVVHTMLLRHMMHAARSMEQWRGGGGAPENRGARAWTHQNADGRRCQHFRVLVCKILKKQFHGKTLHRKIADVVLRDGKCVRVARQWHQESSCIVVWCHLRPSK